MQEIKCYSDELNDEFSGISRNTKTIGSDYKFINRNLLWRFASIIAHRVIAIPLAFAYCKIKFSFKLFNKEKLRPFLRKGCYLYGNHTQVPGDGFMQALTGFPRKNYVVVNADNVSLKGTEQFMLMIGAVPLPSGLSGYRNFRRALSERIRQGHPIVIYPEAHIWPYYTGIRPFKSASFKYAVEDKVPAFSFTAVYKKRKRGNKPKIEMYIDGPFYPDDALGVREAAQKLRDQVYDAMRTRASQSDCEYIKYVKKSVEDSDKQ